MIEMFFIDLPKQLILQLFSKVDVKIKDEDDERCCDDDDAICVFISR